MVHVCNHGSKTTVTCILKIIGIITTHCINRFIFPRFRSQCLPPHFTPEHLVCFSHLSIPVFVPFRCQHSCEVTQPSVSSRIFLQIKAQETHNQDNRAITLSHWTPVTIQRHSACDCVSFISSNIAIIQQIPAYLVANSKCIVWSISLCLSSNIQHHWMTPGSTIRKRKQRERASFCPLSPSQALFYTPILCKPGEVVGVPEQCLVAVMDWLGASCYHIFKSLTYSIPKEWITFTEDCFLHTWQNVLHIHPEIVRTL